MVRDACRATPEGQVSFLPIIYRDVFREVFDHFRKGKFSEPYMIVTKTVAVEEPHGDVVRMTSDVTIEYRARRISR
jgi:hypothetical protein